MKILKNFFLLILIPYLLISQNFKFTNFTTNNGLAANNVISIFSDNNQNLWFGFQGQGVTKFDGSNFITYTTTNGLPNNFINDIAQHPTTGNLLFATNNGLSSFDGSNFSNSLAGISLTCIFIDNQNNIWVGTNGSGARKFDGTQWHSYTTVNGLVHNDVRAIAQDSNNCMWFGTPIGVSKYDGVTWKTYTDTNGLISNGNSVTSIAVDHTGKVWIGSKTNLGIGGGISIFDGNTWTTLTQSDGLVSNNISKIKKDPRNNMWIATANAGASLFINGTFLSFNTPIGLISNNINDLHIDTSNKVYFGTFGGAAILTPLSINSVQIIDGTCNTDSLGSIIINADGLFPPLYFSVGGSYQASNIFNLPAGNYYISVKDSLCVVFGDTVEINLIPPLQSQLPDSASLCFGDTLLLTANSVCSNFHWTPPEIVSDSYSYQTYVFTDSSQYVYVSMVDTNGCHIIDSTYIFVYPQIILNINIIDDSVFAVIGNFQSYQWYLNGDIINGATDSIYHATVAGIYQVMVTDENGCSAISDSIFYNVPFIHEIPKNNDIKILTEKNKITINVNNLNLLHKGIFVFVYNNVGQKIYSTKLVNKNQIIMIDGDSSIYYIILKTEENIILAKKIFISK